MRNIRPALAALAALVLTLLPTSAHAHPSADLADPDALAAEVQRVLELAPGGVEIAPGKISWNDGEVVLTLEGSVSPDALADCDPNRYCAWTATSFTGSLFTFSACSTGGTTVSIPAGYTARSLANMRSTGYVTAGAYTVNAGNSVSSASGTITSMRCYS